MGLIDIKFITVTTSDTFGIHFQTLTQSVWRGHEFYGEKQLAKYIIHSTTPDFLGWPLMLECEHSYLTFK